MVSRYALQCRYPGILRNKTNSRVWEHLDALAAATSTLSVDAQKRAEKDAAKKAQKAEAAEAKHARMSPSPKVYLDPTGFATLYITTNFPPHRNHSSLKGDHKTRRAQ